MGIKRCPKCGNARLLAKKITSVQIESLDNGEFKINAESPKYQLEIVGCAKCKAEFDESQLVEMTQCKKCGKYVNPTELDINGECEVCQALTENPDLANMSKEDVLRMYLRLQRSTSNTMEPVQPVASIQPQQAITEEIPVSSVAEEKMKAAQAAINNVSNEFSQEIIKETVEEQQEVQEMVEDMQQEAMNPPVIDDSAVESEKPKRGRPRKKSDVETSESGEVTEEQVQQSANEMADFQEAPFPEQDATMQQMFSNEPVAPQEETQVSYLNATVNNGATTAQSPFQMFENEQSF